MALRRFLDGDNALVREVRAVLARAEFAKPPAAPPTERYREQVMERARTLAATGGPALLFPAEFGGLGRVGAAITAFETLAHSDLSLLVKCGVQFGLFGGAVHHLGTGKHHEAYLPRIASLELVGCFAMSETGHGSNVQRVETTATWDNHGQEFVISTPTESARKDYIGSAARDGHMAAVFCQLVVGGESRGVHALLVPIRDDEGSPAEGVEISDCGEKLGLNGVDNGRLAFHDVRVGRDALLDRYAEVTPDGEYRSPIENENRRFFTMLGTLVQGRVSVGGAAISATKSALTIAVRHGARRRQFGPPDSDEELPLLDFRVHQRRLLPPLATTYALHFAQEGVVAELDRIFGSLGAEEDEAERDRRELETRAAGLKAVATWHATETIQTCREACGGAGYLSENRLGELKADTDVFTTFEGDNTILFQLVAKSLLTGYRDHFGDLGPIATAGFVASQAWETVVERTGGRELLQRLTDDLVPGRERDEDLLDREYHLGLFRWREEHVLSGAARRLRRGMSKRRRSLHGVQRLPGPRPRGREGPRAPRDPGVLLRGDRAHRRRGPALGVEPALRPLRHERAGARARLVPGARAHLLDPGEDDHAGRERPVRGASPARRGARRRLRHPGRGSRRADRAARRRGQPHRERRHQGRAAERAGDPGAGGGGGLR